MTGANGAADPVRPGVKAALAIAHVEIVRRVNAVVLVRVPDAKAAVAVDRAVKARAVANLIAANHANGVRRLRRCRK